MCGLAYAQTGAERCRIFKLSSISTSLQLSSIRSYISPNVSLASACGVGVRRGPQVGGEVTFSVIRLCHKRKDDIPLNDALFLCANWTYWSPRSVEVVDSDTLTGWKVYPRFLPHFNFSTSCPLHLFPCPPHHICRTHLFELFPSTPVPNLKPLCSCSFHLTLRLLHGWYENTFLASSSSHY
jgi:hypothetical protein